MPNIGSRLDIWHNNFYSMLQVIYHMVVTLRHTNTEDKSRILAFGLNGHFH